MYFTWRHTNLLHSAFIQNHKWNTIEKLEFLQVVSGWKWLGPSCECCRKLRLLVVTHGKDVGDPVLEQRHDCRCFTYWWENREGDSQVKSGHTEEYFVCSQKVRLHFLRESSQKNQTNTQNKRGSVSSASPVRETPRRSAEICFKAAPALNWLPPAGGAGVTEREAPVDSVENKLGQCGSKLMCGARSHKDRSSNTTP